MRGCSLFLTLSACISQFLLCSGFSYNCHPRISHHAKNSRLSPRFEGYVPDGLSPEEYRKIKKEEAARLKNKNFGRFGPRFLKSNERPQGDWFLMPSLWTGGYDSNSRSNRFMSSSNNNGDKNKIQALFADIASFFKTYGPAMFLAYLAIDVGIAMEASFRAAHMKPRQLIGTFIKAFIWAKRQNMWLVWWKAQTVKCGLTLLLTWPSQKWIDHAENKWGWSEKYIVLVTSGILIGGSLSYSILLVALRKFGFIG